MPLARSSARGQRPPNRVLGERESWPQDPRSPMLSKPASSVNEQVWAENL